MIFRYHLFRLFFWGVSSIIGTGRTVLFPLIIALFSGTATFVIATTGATSRVVFGRFMGGIIILPTLAKKMCALLANVN